MKVDRGRVAELLADHLREGEHHRHSTIAIEYSLQIVAGRVPAVERFETRPDPVDDFR